MLWKVWQFLTPHFAEKAVLPPAAPRKDRAAAVRVRAGKAGRAAADLLADTHRRDPGFQAADAALHQAKLLLSDLRRQGRQAPFGRQPSDLRWNLSPRIDENLALIKETFRIPSNHGIVVRKFTIPTTPPTKAFAVYIDQMVDKNQITQAVLGPVFLGINLWRGLPRDQLPEALRSALLPNQEIKTAKESRKVVAGILAGNTALFLDGHDRAVLIDTKGGESRPIGEPRVERVVRGPSTAFSELLMVNISLVRRILKTPELVSEILEIGSLSKTRTAIMYVKGLANRQLVAEVRRRVRAVKDLDTITDSGMLDQFITDNPTRLVPTILDTERPDRVAAGLSEGRVVLMVDNSPFALVMPSIWADFIQSPEDYYLRWPYGSLLRVLRLTAIFLATFTPALYIAITNYHQEMIPTSLLLSLAASREPVPFPVAVEVFMMEFSFEFIREAGIRIPGPLGPTIGIVGALLIGEAAVQAGIISPFLVILVAVTAIASFLVPNTTAQFAMRLLRFFFMIGAAILGLYGVAAGIYLLGLSLAGTKSFGVPFLSHISPSRQGSMDQVIRGPLYSQEKRPASIKPRNLVRQPNVLRAWVAPFKHRQRAQPPYGGDPLKDRGQTGDETEP
ncbi:MAG: spore germination protein [Firmicutes bacterium]|nr:spore germination protein [Bacillota bacterium]